MSAADPQPGLSGRVLGVVTVAVVAVLVAPLLVAIVFSVRTGDSGTAVPRTAQHSAVVSPSAVASSAKPRQSATCWDGRAAEKVSTCTQPAGAAGLAWVFPSQRVQQCSKVTAEGPAGVVLRRVCHAPLPGGGSVQIVYSQWRTGAAAEAFLRGAGFTPVTTGRGPADVRRFVAAATSRSDRGRAAEVYDDEPFGYTMTLRKSDLAPLTVAGQVVRQRPANQVRGTRR